MSGEPTPFGTPLEDPMIGEPGPSSILICALATGGIVDLARPSPDSISILDIAEGLVRHHDLRPIGHRISSTATLAQVAVESAMTLMNDASPSRRLEILLSFAPAAYLGWPHPNVFILSLTLTRAWNRLLRAILIKYELAIPPPFYVAKPIRAWSRRDARSRYVRRFNDLLSKRDRLAACPATTSDALPVTGSGS